MFPSKPVPRIPNNFHKNPPFYTFDSFLIVLVTPSNKTLESSKAGTIFIPLFISLFDIIKVVVPEPCIFFEFLHQLLK